MQEVIWRSRAAWLGQGALLLRLILHQPLCISCCWHLLVAWQAVSEPGQGGYWLQLSA